MSDVVITICDKCGPEEQRHATTKAAFEVEGKSYTVDVCAEHERDLIALTRAWSSWVKIGTPLSRRAAARTRKDQPEAEDGAPVTGEPVVSVEAAQPATRGEAHVNDIRTWARSQGMDVHDRGRISDDIIEAYNAAHDPPELLSVSG